MLVPQLFRQLQISPRVAFWVSISALVIVLLNDHIYMVHVQEREKFAQAQMLRNIAEADDLSKRERLLRTWEIQLMERENELRKLIQAIPKAQAPR